MDRQGDAVTPVIEGGRKFGATINTVVLEGARAFFGHHVESMLKTAHCPLVVLSAG